tara:strand:+ start:865 stop:1056 length:192 start_codon:yes stop_codon:yes gene_type:complete
LKNRTNKQNKKQLKHKGGGKKAGIIETATVPFGLFAAQYLYARSLKKRSKSKKSKKSTKKSKK